MKISGVIQSAKTVGLFTGLSRLLGMTRDILMATFFGTGIYMSAFVLAFKIPNLFRRLFGEGALAAAFIPVFVETKSNEGDHAAWTLAGQILGLLLVVLVSLLLLGWGLIGIGSFYMDSPFASLTLSLLAIMLPYMVFICLAALAMSMLNSFRHFAVPAFAPCLLNIVWILCVIVGFRFIGTDDSLRIHVLAWCILFAGVLQLGVQLPMLYRFGFRGNIAFNFKDEKVRRILLLMGPATLGMAVTQLNVMVDGLLAALIGTHAPAALFFSERLIYLPLGIFATAMGTVLLPIYSKQASDGSSQQQLTMVHHSFRVLCFIMIPASFGLFALAEPIIRMLLEQGEFDWKSVFYTTKALQFYAPGLVLFSLAKIFVPVFYSHQDTRTPMMVGVGCVGINFALNILFMVTWPEEIKHAGLAFATVLSEGIFVCVLTRIFHRRFGSPDWAGMLRAVFRFIIAGVVMAGAVVFIEGFLFSLGVNWGAPDKGARILSVLGSITGGGAVYFGIAFLFRYPELNWVLRRDALR